MAEYQFENLPNFRQAGGNSLTTVDGRTAKDGIIYRSSRTDFITQKDVTVFQQLGIKSIIDLRGRREYQLSDGDKRLKKLYTPFTVKNGKLNRLKSSLDEDSTSFGNRYLISMTSVKLIWYLFNKLNIFVRWFTLLIALYDWLMSTHYFIKLYNHMVLNDISMAERYMDVLEYNKGAVRDCFKVLCDRSNLPVLIHCAHGKDRTGLIVALALSCVGVKDDDVVNDYSLSENGLSCIKQRVYHEVVETYGFDEKFLSSEPKVMRTVLKELKERYGSVNGYLLSTGITHEELEILRDVLTEQN